MPSGDKHKQIVSLENRKEDTAGHCTRCMYCYCYVCAVVVVTVLLTQLLFTCLDTMYFTSRYVAYSIMRGGQLKRELGDKGGSWKTKGWEKNSLGRKLTLYGGRWVTVGREYNPPCLS